MDTQEYQTLREQYDAHVQAMREQYPGKNAFTQAELATLPPCPTNEQKSAVEVYEFLHEKPELYTAYVSMDGKTVTTWMGDVLGTITFYGKRFTSNFGDKRQHIEVKGVNGRRYHGYATDAGTYVNLRAYKEF